MDDQQYYVASPDAKVNVRSVPQTGEVLFQVNPMQNIIADAVTAEYSTIDGVRDRWVRIRADGKTGWLFGGFLDADRGIVKYPGVDQFPE
jgi:SH3-like domain-containing protein